MRDERREWRDTEWKSRNDSEQRQNTHRNVVTLQHKNENVEAKCDSSSTT